MKCFIGIVPPAEISDAIANIQQQFGDNRLEPHITLRPPVTVSNPTEWMERIKAVSSSFPPVTITLTGTGNFGKSVLFIAAKSKKLEASQVALAEVLKEYEQEELNQKASKPFHPHLTLGRLWCEFTTEDFKQMKMLADDFLSRNPVSFKANFIRVYYKPSGNSRYTLLEDLALISAH